MNNTANTTDAAKLTLAIRQTLENSGPAGAERQLTIIAKEEGDEALAIIVKELRPVEVTALLAEGDFTKPSLISSFVSAEQFIGAIDRIGAKWGKITKEDKGGVITRLQGEVADLILSVILPAPEDKKSELVAALLQHKLGVDIIVAIALNQHDMQAFLTEGCGEGVTSQLGTWQELYGIIADENPGKHKKIVAEVLYMYPKEEADVEIGRGKTKSENFIRKTLMALGQSAEKLAEVGSEKKTEEVFVNLD